MRLRKQNQQEVRPQTEVPQQMLELTEHGKEDEGTEGKESGTGGFGLWASGRMRWVQQPSGKS